MGYKRALKDEERGAVYDEYIALKDIGLSSWWRYGLVAFALQSNRNPNTPMSGYAVYACEAIRRTRKSVTVAPLQLVKMKGKGIAPRFPYVVRFGKNKNAKLILVKEEN